MKEKHNGTSINKILHSIDSLKYKMIFYSFIIGIISGVVMVLYRVLGEFFLEKFIELYSFVKFNMYYFPILILFLLVLALIVSWCVKKEPNISGSGIPHVEGIIKGKIKVNYIRVLFYKFLGGIITLSTGLSVGREGPSIQMGAAIGQGVANHKKCMAHEEKYLITSGAAAGLSAAFNAPLAGVMFALEEVHKNFSPIVLTSAMVSALTADITSKSILGISPALRFSEVPIIPIKYYWCLIVLGIFTGISSYFFNKGIIKVKKLYNKINCGIRYKIICIFFISALIGILFPMLSGGGHHIIMQISYLNVSIFMIFIILIIKFIFTFISFGSGVPGGIFFPLLAIGAILGNLIGVISINYLGVEENLLINFVILAMAGHFAAIVKAPITSVILIYEMTASFEQLLPLSVVVFSALITSDALGVEPIYDMLLHNITNNQDENISDTNNNSKTLIQVSVHLGSLVDGKKIRDITLPEKCLLVAIERGNKEIIPKGNTKIMCGDLLLAMVNESDYSATLEYLSDITGS